MGSERQPDEGTRDEILAAVLTSVIEYAYALGVPAGRQQPPDRREPPVVRVPRRRRPPRSPGLLDRVDPPRRPRLERGHPLAPARRHRRRGHLPRDPPRRLHAWLLERWRCRPGRDGAVIVDGIVTDVSALRNTEVAWAARSLLAAVVSAVDAYVYCWDYDVDGRGTPVYESVPAHLFLRTRPSADPNEPWRTTLVPEDREGARVGVEQREAGQDGIMEWRCRGDDGEVRWLRDAWRCGAFRDGRRRIYGMVVDVSETVSARKDAAETRAHLDAVVEAIEDYVYAWAYEPDGTVAVSFESVPQARFLGVDDRDDDAVDLWRSCVHPDDLAGFDELIERQRRCQAAAAEYRVSVDGGGWRWLYDRSHGRRVPDGRVLAEGIVSDVTRQRETQEQLREHDAIFRTLAAALPMSMWTEDAEGRVDFVNAQAEELWGLRRDEFATPAWQQRVHPEDRGRVADTTGRLEDSEVEFRIVLPDGSLRDVASRRRVVRRPNGDIIGFVGTDVDVTAERAAAADLHAHVRRLDQANVELETARREADVRSRTDALTGLANRRHFTEELVAELRRAAHAGGPPAVLLLDIDRFKAVNDTYGHAVGDVVLAGVAERIEGALRAGSVAARWGGEEFAVLVPDVADDAALRGVGERIRQAVGEQPIPTPGGELHLSVSVGGARWIGVAQGADALVDAADRALYAAKRRGRDQTRLAIDLTGEDLLAEEPEAVRIAQALALATSVREGMPELHCEQVSELSAAIARELGLPPALVFRCRLGGLLHDVGKVAIPDRILAKPGPLDDAEWRVMVSHAAIGEQLVSRLSGLREAAAAVRHHHERWDGAGYPDGLAADEIPLEARIVAVADAYSAITSDRVYQRGRERTEALTELRRTAGAHHDAAVVDALVRVLLVDARAVQARMRAGGSGAAPRPERWHRTRRAS